MLQADQAQPTVVPGSHQDPLADLLALDSILFKKDVMYQHNVLRINYTTYDVRRAQDVINPNTDHRDVMLLALTNDSGLAYSEVLGLRPGLPRSNHQYQYARVLGIYHVNVIYTGLVAGKQDLRHRRMEFLFVRWFDCPQTSVQSGWSTGQLDTLVLRESDRGDAFGFVDPAQVLRGCHIIPQFCLGHRRLGVGRSEYAKDQKDWCKYYVNR